jgi:hypothetical protein
MSAGTLFRARIVSVFRVLLLFLPAIGPIFGHPQVAAVAFARSSNPQHTLSQVLQDIGRSDAVICTTGLFGIANASGRDALPPAEAVHVCERIAQGIRTRYTMGDSISLRILV